MLRNINVLRLAFNSKLINRQISSDSFAERHIGPTERDQREMLDYIGFQSLDQLVDQNVPENIRLRRQLSLPKALNEREMLAELRKVAENNQIYRSYIGMGFYDCIVPSVIRRNMLENSGWLASYTPYQAEISQGRLESLLNFQTMISDLTGLQVANASLLDEASACAESITLACRATKRQTILFDPKMHPQNLDLLKTRADPLDIKLKPLNLQMPEISSEVAAIIIQYPNTEGLVQEGIQELIEEAHKHGALAIMICDPLALAVMKSPGDMNADIAVGSAQRFGLPLSYGGPHPGFIAVAERERNSLARLIPGRIVGVSKDVDGNPAYRLTWQAREQHIRRDKATALTANMSAMFAVFHGPDRLKLIATQVHKNTAYLAEQLHSHGNQIVHQNFFDTLKIRPKDMADFKVRCADKKINVRYFENSYVGISLDETVSIKDLIDILSLFGIEQTEEEIERSIANTKMPIFENSQLLRTSKYLQHPVFNSYHSEFELVRYMKRLENKDLSLVNAMIPLGSCTMKLNASVQLLPVTWQKFSSLHPFAPEHQAQGYAQIFNDLNKWLCEITGYDRFSFQPNSGANGEYAGLLAIRGYQHSLGQEQRKVCLIPTSAHGTNPSSAQMAGFKVKPVESDKFGNVNFKDLSEKVEKYKDELGALMITYPSTHGVFENQIKDICAKIHENGGQVYLDGANFNAQTGLCRPGEYGSDVSHLNLHKTFVIPRGGGGPGAGPIGVKQHLAKFLPGHPVVPQHEEKIESGAVCSSPFGPSNLLMITWAYIRLMGADGLKNSTEIAILNANYMAKRLENGGYNVLYRNENGLNAHEFLLDCKPFRKQNVSVIDIAKRLMDYGFHSPTVSWPVNGCLMIEPTESESKAEMDRYIEALLQIREEIRKIESSHFHPHLNPLKLAPHTAHQAIINEWTRPYSLKEAIYPKKWCISNKFWPSVGRIDEKFGDMNLFCNCPPVEAYAVGQEDENEIEEKRQVAGRL